MGNIDELVDDITDNDYNAIKAAAEAALQYYKIEKGMLFLVLLVSENKEERFIKYALVPRDIELIQAPYKVINKSFIKEFEDMLSGINPTDDTAFINRVIYTILIMLKELRKQNEEKGN